jgi:hypothetical protein
MSWGYCTEYLLTQRFSVVLMSNQFLKSSELVEWKKKIPLIAAAVRIAHSVIRRRSSTAVLDIPGNFRYPNSRFEYLQPRREMGTGSLCLGCGLSSSVFLPKTESR